MGDFRLRRVGFGHFSNCGNVLLDALISSISELMLAWVTSRSEAEADVEIFHLPSNGVVRHGSMRFTFGMESIAD